MIKKKKKKKKKRKRKESMTKIWNNDKKNAPGYKFDFNYTLATEVLESILNEGQKEFP